jgi:hypothetical protein
MKYFDRILNGNIPMSIVDSQITVPSDYKLDDFSYYNLNNVENMANINENGNSLYLLNSKNPKDMYKDVYELNNRVKRVTEYNSVGNESLDAAVATSVSLNRTKVILGTNNIFKLAINNALNRNKPGLNAISEIGSNVPSTKDNLLIFQVTNNFINDISNFMNKVIDNIKTSKDNKRILQYIVDMTGLTNKSDKQLDDIEKELSLLLELHQNFATDLKLDMNGSIKSKLDVVNVRKCKDNITYDCLFNDTFVNNMSVGFVDVLEKILENILNNSKYDRLCNVYSISVDLASLLSSGSEEAYKLKLKQEEQLKKSKKFVNDDYTKITTMLNNKYDRDTDVRNYRSILKTNADNRYDVFQVQDNIEGFSDVVASSFSSLGNEHVSVHIPVVTDAKGNVKISGIKQTASPSGVSIKHNSDSDSESDKHHTDSDSKIHERFAGINIGNTKSTDKSKKQTDITDIEKNIDNSKVIKGMTSMLSKSIKSATSSNSAALQQAIKAANDLEITGITSTDGSVKISKVSQKISVDSQTKMDAVQKIANKVVTDISNVMTKNITDMAKNSTSDTSTTKEKDSQGTNVGQTLGNIASAAGGVVNNLVDKAADVLSMNIGNSTSDKSSEEKTKMMKDKYNLNDSFKHDSSNDVKNDLQTLLSSSNLASAAKDVAAANKLKIANVKGKGNVTIDELVQEVNVKDVMDAIFNQTVLNEISEKIMNQQDEMIKKISDNRSDKMTQVEKDKQNGDLQAAGTAAKAILQGAGEAVKDVGTGVATAAKGAGEGISSAAKGVGQGISTAAEGVGAGVGNILAKGTVLWIVLAIVGLIGAFGYYWFFIRSPSASTPEQSGGLNFLHKLKKNKVSGLYGSNIN